MRQIKQITCALHSITKPDPKTGVPTEGHILMIVCVDHDGLAWEFNAGKRSWDQLPPLPEQATNHPPINLPPNGVKS